MKIPKKVPQDLSLQTSLESSMLSVCTAWKMCACTSAAGSPFWSTSMSHVLNCTPVGTTDKQLAGVCCCSIMLRNSLCGTFDYWSSPMLQEVQLNPTTPFLAETKIWSFGRDNVHKNSLQSNCTPQTQQTKVIVSLELVVGQGWSSIAAVSGTQLNFVHTGLLLCGQCQLLN